MADLNQAQASTSDNNSWQMVASSSGKGENENGSSQRWTAALSNLTEMEGSINSLQQVLLRKVVYVDDESFVKAKGVANQARIAMAQERRIKALEKEVDAAVSAARQAQAEKKQAEAAQRLAEAKYREIIGELENTSQVFKLHMEELRLKQEENAKKDAEIKVLKAIIEAMGEKSSNKSTKDRKPK